METQQLSVFDQPRDNILEVLPRFSLPDCDSDAIAQFAALINEVRLDQLQPELAGNGKNGKHLQPNLPIEIKIEPSDRAGIDDSKLDFSGILPELENIPEKSEGSRRYGCIEQYTVKVKSGKLYEYHRYVYIDDKGKYRHHHISKQQLEGITELWRSGATPKKICVALGKICELK